MRLLHTRNLKFQDFYDTAVPSYAILSHRWSGQEVSFQAFRAESASLEAGSGIGFRKIAKCCQLAADRSFDWVCIDTCCIDQTSSAELTEAINSMFSWYTSAGECYAYLQMSYMRTQVPTRKMTFVTVAFPPASGSRVAGRFKNSSPPKMYVSTIPNGLLWERRTILLAS